MNKNSRARIETVKGQLEELSAEIEALTEEEQEAYDNLPEGLQESECGKMMQPGYPTNSSYLCVTNAVGQRNTRKHTSTSAGKT